MRAVGLVLGIAILYVGLLAAECWMVYELGELHGRFVAESGIGGDLRECRGRLDTQEFAAASCDRALLDCKDSARFVGDEAMR